MQRVIRYNVIFQVPEKSTCFFFKHQESEVKSYWLHVAGDTGVTYTYEATNRCRRKNRGFQRKMPVSAEVMKSRDWMRPRGHEKTLKVFWAKARMLDAQNLRSVHFVHGLCLCDCSDFLWLLQIKVHTTFFVPHSLQTRK